MSRLLLSAALLAAASVPTASIAHAEDACARPRIMVILDKSSSMVTGTIGGETKWDVAVGGLDEVLAAYEQRAEFGLMTFPRPNECAPGGVDVSPGIGSRQAILGALTTPPPDAGNWTPMAQTLEVAATEPSLAAAGAARHVVVITDGWQWCSPYDPATRFDGVPAVDQLTAAGITTWVVGFGAEVDAAALDQMAVAAGTAKPGCDPDSGDPAAPDHCYFQVDNAAELVAALDTIAGAIAEDEQCDGIDNDCDGEIDEDLVRDCSNDCGAGTETCSDGAWVGCTAPPDATCTGDDGDDGDDGNGDTGEGDDGGLGGTQAGCACTTGGLPDGSALAAFALVGVLVLRRRR